MRNPEFSSLDDSDPQSLYEQRIYEGGGMIPRPELIASFSSPNVSVRTSMAEQLAHLNRPERFTERELGFVPEEGEPQLPVHGFKDVIQTSVLLNQVTIVTAETGAGKSTQIPQYLLEMGYRVSMTQPRRLSATFLAERVQDELEVALEGADEYDSHLSGLLTAKHNTVIEGKTKITVVTDGLRLIQEYGERPELSYEVLIIDETHEWNSNIEMLTARVYQMVQDRPDIRVVIMSATMDARELADYFDEVLGKGATPVIEIPGRNHEVAKLTEPSSDIVKETLKYVAKDESVLVFVPGVREIDDTISALNKELAGKNVTILPLHSKLSKQDQDAVRQTYAGPKIIVATNIAQTSITIPDINVVVDSGLHRQDEIDEQGTGGIFLRHASRADMDQRAGRTGRVAPGTYIHTRLNESAEFVPYTDARRTDYPIPQILRSDVDRNMLMAADARLDFASFRLKHPVEREVIDRSKAMLVELGALDENFQITPRGERMAPSKLPIRPRFARILIETEDRNYSVSVRNQAAAMIAALEAGGIPSWLRNSSREWRDLTEQPDSDHIAQLDVFIAAMNMSKTDAQHMGIDLLNLEKAKETHEKLKRRMHIPAGQELIAPTPEEREQLRLAIASSMTDFVYYRNGVKEYARVDRNVPGQRSITDRSTLISSPKLVVGTPYAIERQRRDSTETEHVIQDVTAVTQQHLAAVATDRHLSWENGELRWSKDRLVRIQHQMFKKSVDIGLFREVEPEATEEVLSQIVQKSIEDSGNALNELKAIKKRLEKLQQITTEKLNTITEDDLKNIVRQALGGRTMDQRELDWRIREIIQAKDLTTDSYISAEKRDEIARNALPEVEHEGYRMRLHYHNGGPRHTVQNINTIIEFTDQPVLPDGREILFVLERHEYTLAQLKAKELEN